MNKSELRQSMLRIRGEQVVDATRFATQFMQSIFDYAGDYERATIAVYIATKGEVDTQPLINVLAREAQLCLPVCIAPATPMVFRAYDRNTPLVKDSEGMSVPPESAGVCSPDIVLVPLLAFDKSGTRLGRGGGYYDRTLSVLSPRLAIGLAYDAQRLDDCPKDTHDQPLDYVITQTQIYDCTRK